MSCIIGAQVSLDDGIVFAQYQNSIVKMIGEIEFKFENQQKFFLNCLQNQKKREIEQAKEEIREKLNLSKRKANKFDKIINANSGLPSKLKRSRQCYTGRDFFDSQYVSTDEKLRRKTLINFLPRSLCHCHHIN